MSRITVACAAPDTETGAEGSAPPRPARRAWAILRARRRQPLAKLVALLVDRGDDEAHRHADVDQHILGELQARLNRLWHRIGHTEPIKRAGVVGVAGTRDQRDV